MLLFYFFEWNERRWNVNYHVKSPFNNTPIFRVMSLDIREIFYFTRAPILLLTTLSIGLLALLSCDLQAKTNIGTSVYQATDSLTLSYAIGITIKGTTSITEFQCKNTFQKHIDSSSRHQNYEIIHALPSDLRQSRTVWYNQLNESIVFEPFVLDFQIQNFDCGGMGINRDFRKTLKANLYPNLLIRPINLTSDSLHLNKYRSMVSITLAGYEKTVPIMLSKFISDLSKEQPNTNLHVLFTEKNLLMTDFNIEPPRPLFGLIEVNNELMIELEIYIAR